MSTRTRPAFTVAEEDDRLYASDGRSRFGAYLRQQASMFLDGDEMTIEDRRFALAAWRIAQSPIMAPGYVQPHPRLQGTDEHWDDEGRVALTVYLATLVPAAVSRGINTWQWRGWEQAGHVDSRWVQPYDNDRPAVFTVVALRIPLVDVVLPAPCYRSGIADTDTAQRAVRVVCELLNRALCPVLAELDT